MLRQKSNLRQDVLSRIKKLSELERQLIADKLAHQLFQTSLWHSANIIGITCSTGLEWDTRRIIERAWEENKQIVVPKTYNKEKKMCFYLISSFNDVIPGYANILEPIVKEDYAVSKNNIDLLIVPGVVFDRYGYRIGFGGGYYDRFLTDFKNSTVSLVSHLQLIEQLPIEPHDLAVHYIVTEKECKEVYTK